MGGLVSKGALDDLARNGRAAQFSHLELQAFGTPWGGFAMAESAHILPGGALISRAVGFPMGPDIGPGSQFMESLSQPWPENMALHIYQGTADHVAQPEASSTSSRYNSIEANAQSITLIDGFKHTDYRNAGPELMNASRQTPVQGFEAVQLEKHTPSLPRNKPLKLLKIRQRQSASGEHFSTARQGGPLPLPDYLGPGATSGIP